MWNNSLRELWNLMLRIKWNEINPLTPAGISHCEALFHTRSVFHKSRKGFISLKKTYALYQSIGLFLAEAVRFELTVGLTPSLVFKTSSINHSDKPPHLGQFSIFLETPLELRRRRKHYNSQSATAATAILIWGSKMQSRFQDRAVVTTSVALHTGAS